MWNVVLRQIVNISKRTVHRIVYVVRFINMATVQTFGAISETFNTMKILTTFVEWVTKQIIINLQYLLALLNRENCLTEIRCHKFMPPLLVLHNFQHDYWETVYIYILYIYNIYIHVCIYNIIWKYIVSYHL